VPTLRWKGTAPPPSLARALAQLGWKLDRRGDGPLLVVATGSGERAPAGTPPWVWVARDAIAPAAADQAVLAGAVDCVSLALGPAAAAARLVRRVEEADAREPPPPATPSFVTAGAAGQNVLRQLARAARTSQPVLLTGETGTGKEVAARLIHTWSARAAGPFVPVNCAAIPNDLMEAELFGYARGAFSGAVRAYEGQIAAAAGGTVFLDEIDDTPASIQVKLLRVLEDRVVHRLGENVWRGVDFRLVAATNRDLAPLIADGRFGADLYERLAIVSIQLPPLRRRAGDISVLAEHFARRFAEEEGRAAPVAMTPEALAALERYPWPGNVRELRNVIYQSLVEKRAGGELLLSDLPRRILGARAGADGEPWLEAARRGVAAGSFHLHDAVRELERVALGAALERTRGNAAEAARILGAVGRGTSRDPGGTVRAMMRRLGVTRERRRK
jgi:DNA-binding NtrC family response regulator